jgi:hypothetical protein
MRTVRYKIDAYFTLRIMFTRHPRWKDRKKWRDRGGGGIVYGRRLIPDKKKYCLQYVIWTYIHACRRRRYLYVRTVAQMKTTCKSAVYIFPARQLKNNWLKYPRKSQLADFCTSITSRTYWQYNWRILLNITTLQDRYSTLFNLLHNEAR